MRIGGLILALLGACACARADVTTREFIVNGMPVAGVVMGGAVEVSADAADGKGRCVKATLPAGIDWPGVSMTFAEPQDWSEESALKFDLILESDKPVAFNLRVDRVGSTDADFKSRFNLGGVKELTFQPGTNSFRVSIERMVNGHLNNPGLDVTKITKVTLFTAKQAKEVGLGLRRVWLEKGTPAAGEVIVSNFIANGFAGWRSTNGAILPGRTLPGAGFEIKVRPQPFTKDRPTLAVMETDALPSNDWQGYDRLVVGMVNSAGHDLPAGINLLDRNGKEVMYRFKARPGPSEIELPLAAAEIIDLSRVANVKLLFTSRTDGDMTVGLSRLALKRSEGRRVTLVEAPGALPKEGDFAIDLAKFYDSRGDRRLADVIVRAGIPEKQYVFRCRPASTNVFKLVVPPEFAANCSRGEAWAVGFYINHGEMLTYTATAKVEQDHGITWLRFTDGVGP